MSAGLSLGGFWERRRAQIRGWSYEVVEGESKPCAVESAALTKLSSRPHDEHWADTLGAARRVYAVHSERPFYDALVAFMTSGPVLPMVLEADRAVPSLREVIGATDPAEAAPGTVRQLYAESKERNAIHASDSDENAQTEIAFFFPASALL